jgi:hypothetical protein
MICLFTSCGFVLPKSLQILPFSQFLVRLFSSFILKMIENLEIISKTYEISQQVQAVQTTKQPNVNFQISRPLPPPPPFCPSLLLHSPSPLKHVQ